MAILHVESIAKMSRTSSLSGFVIGTNDLAKEMRCRLDVQRAPLISALSMAVIASKAYGLGIIDGVYNELDDDDGFRKQAEQGSAMGFDGKTLIHPRQIEVANHVFSPTESELARSRSIVRAFDDPVNAGKGVLKVDGAMVELLHLEMARRTLATAEQIEKASEC